MLHLLERIPFPQKYISRELIFDLILRINFDIESNIYIYNIYKYLYYNCFQHSISKYIQYVSFFRI